MVEREGRAINEEGEEESVEGGRAVEREVRQWGERRGKLMGGMAVERELFF